jgi:predicted metal-binding membrane protein
MTDEAAPAAVRPPARLAPEAIGLRALLVALTAAAWLALWSWSASPYARYLDHGGWGDAGALAALCRAVPAGGIVVPALLHSLGWVLMVAAMMLPTTLPILGLFRRMTAHRPDGRRLAARVVAGYFIAWLGFGLAAHGLDWGVHALGGRSPWLADHGWIVGAATVLGAGLFQFSALKYRCLDKCHTPLGFVLARWHGVQPAREALRIGFDHGLFCVGCCWALMLLMFVVGTGSIGWMLALAAVMAAEKNLPGGRRLRAPLGIALLAAAAIVVAIHTGPFDA